MRKMTMTWLFALAALALPMRTGLAELVAGTCDAKFRVNATMHRFTGSASCDPIALQWQDGKATLDAQVEVVKMITGNTKRDKEMFHMFNAEAHPYIKGHAAGVALKEVKVGDTFPFTLAMSGQSRELTATVTAVENLEGGGKAVTTSFDVSLKDFNLAPPKIMFFVVFDIVHVDADFRFSP